jgi:hypothetical protein
MSQEDAKPVQYAMEFKLSAVRRVLVGESVDAVAQELGIRRKRLYVWKDRYAELGEAGLVRRRGGRPRKIVSAAEDGSGGLAGRGELLAVAAGSGAQAFSVGNRRLTLYLRRRIMNGVSEEDL